jgi:hypothetical protein
MPAGNRRLAQWRVQWLIEHSTSLTCPEISLHKTTCKNEKDRSKETPQSSYFL